MRLNREKLKGHLEKVKTTFGKVSKKVWIICVLVAAAVIALVAGINVFSNNSPYSTLITGATSEEATTVMNWLDNQGFTDYKTESAGTILVPERYVYNLKARLLQEKYSTSDALFSGYFEHVNALSTQSERESAWLVALIDELNNTIRQFDGVRDASVTINLGEDRGYVLDANNVVDATASVLLTMWGDAMLTEGQANAIRNYMAASVAGLSVDSVTISDTFGNDYNSLGEVAYAGTGGTSALKLQLEQQWTSMVRSHIMQVLVPAYGQDNVSVAVNCIVEVDEITIEDYEVHLPDYALDGSTNGAGIIGTRVYAYGLIPSDEVAAGGLVGTPTNDIPEYVEAEPGEGDYAAKIEGSGTIEMDNSKTKTVRVRTAGYISDCTATVMINTTTAGIVDEDRVRKAVATAAGITPIATADMTGDEYLASKITVIGQPFYVEPGEEPEPVTPGGTGFEVILSELPLWVIIAAAGGLLLIIVLVVVILLVRRKKRKKKEEEMKQVEELLASVMPGGEGGAEGAGPEGGAEGAGPEGADVMDLDTERSMELRQSIREFVDENMEVAALLVKSWLKEDDENG